MTTRRSHSGLFVCLRNLFDEGLSADAYLAMLAMLVWDGDPLNQSGLSAPGRAEDFISDLKYMLLSTKKTLLPIVQGLSFTFIRRSEGPASDTALAAVAGAAVSARRGRFLRAAAALVRAPTGRRGASADLAVT